MGLILGDVHDQNRSRRHNHGQSHHNINAFSRSALVGGAMNFVPQILIGDIFKQIATIPDESIDCVVTSPPYWGLRDYGVEGQLGLEPTLAEHIDTVVRYCREIMRVLKPSGTFWLNYGDCYATTPNGRSAADTKAVGNDDRTFRDKPFSTIQGTLKPKDLCMVPNRIAIALQDDGWFVRSEIVWAKPNPMPESVTDRPATSHEKIWLLTKAPKYEYDADVVRQSVISSAAKIAYNHKKHGFWGENYGTSAYVNQAKVQSNSTKTPKQRGAKQPHVGLNEKWDKMSKAKQQENGRNLRNWEPAPDIEPALNQPEVWNIATRPFREAHFATFPPELAKRCILSGCPKNGTVLDPFGGAGTVGLVAHRLQRQSILIELNPEYAKIAQKRIHGDAPLLMRGVA